MTKAEILAVFDTLPLAEQLELLEEAIHRLRWQGKVLPRQQTATPTFIEQLMANPRQIPDFTPLSREEIYLLGKN
jgi:hypothetical protein